jgi:hypothetical protein
VKVPWTPDDERRLRKLLRNKRLFVSEIAGELGRKPHDVRYKLRTMGIDVRARAKATGRMGQWNVKHAHLRMKVMTYFLTHSIAETMKKFGLSLTELKSLQTTAYQDEKYDHLRKEYRRHDTWSHRDVLFFLRHAGLQPRLWIALKLRRGGTMHSVKDKVRRFSMNTRYMNGLPQRLARELLGHDDIEGIKVKAGPTGEGVDCRPLLVPWVSLYSKARRTEGFPPHLLGSLRAMSRFQKKVHGTRGILDTIDSIHRILRRK